MWKVDTGSNSGTTTAGYSAALDWAVSELGEKSILLKNTDATLSLKFMLLGYVSQAGVAREIVPETTLLAGEHAEFHYGHQWHRLVLQVVDGSGHAAYQVDHEGQGA